jgi:hypothetical protein
VNDEEIGMHAAARILIKHQTGFKRREALRIVPARAGADLHRKGQHHVANSLAKYLTVINEIVK